MSVLDFMQQAKHFTLEEQQEIIVALQQNLFEHRTRLLEIPKTDVFEVWSPTTDAASMEVLRELVDSK
jgi:hypothetical protein